LLRCLSLYLFAIAAYRQTTFDVKSILTSAFAKRVAATPKAYEWVYHFEELETESNIALVISKGVITAHIRSSEWETKPERWRKVY
jgi:hypothetical protein